MKEALAAEILEAYQGQGNAIRKRDEVHKMAQANKGLRTLPLVVKTNRRAPKASVSGAFLVSKFRCSSYGKWQVSECADEAVHDGAHAQHRDRRAHRCW